MRILLTTLHSKFIHNSLALPSLAAFCAVDCGDLQIREFTIHEPRDTLLAMLLAEEPDVVAFSVYLWNRRETLDLVDALAVARPELRIVLGGPEISFDSHKIFDDHPGLTALIRGEGELPLRALLSAWVKGQKPGPIARLAIRTAEDVLEGPDGPVIDSLNRIPSPYQMGLVDLGRGIVYYETSRGCPFRCGFCLSARDNHMRSYSMERIYSDLSLLMEHQVAKVKLVDRTFNYDAERAREIFTYILEQNRSTHFHFEIAAHLLDDATIELLDRTPPGMFQFEIGVQSYLEETLAIVERQVNLQKMEVNIRRLRSQHRVYLHLDLIAGLPGEDYPAFLSSIDRVSAMTPDHLQIEPVKLLPGSPLREQAEAYGLRFDPNPPYTVLSTRDLDHKAILKLKGISRIIDLTYNTGCFPLFIRQLSSVYQSFAVAMEELAKYWQKHQWFRFPCSRSAVFERCHQFIKDEAPQSKRVELIDCLAFDYARAERVVPSRIPDFFDTDLNMVEREWVQEQVQHKTDLLRGQGVRLQYFAAAFTNLPDSEERSAWLFLYLTRTGQGMSVEAYRYPSVLDDGDDANICNHGPQ